VPRPEFRFALMNWEWNADPQSSGWFVFITGGPDSVPWQRWPHEDVRDDETSMEAARRLVATRLGSEDFDVVTHPFQRGMEDWPKNQPRP